MDRALKVTIVEKRIVRLIERMRTEVVRSCSDGLEETKRRGPRKKWWKQAFMDGRSGRLVATFRVLSGLD